MSNIWFYVPEDKMKITVEGWAAHCKEFSGNEDRCSDIIGGAFDGAVLDAKGVDAISKLPTKQELMQSTAVAIKQTSVQLALTLTLTLILTLTLTPTLTLTLTLTLTRSSSRACSSRRARRSASRRASTRRRATSSRARSTP